MKSLVRAAFVLLPLAALVYLRTFPETDRAFVAPIFHFYIVTFTTFAAAVVSILLAITLGDAASPRHTLASAAFAAIGALFFTHGVATPGALVAGASPVVQWSAWMTLFIGGALFFSGAAVESPRLQGRLSVREISWGFGLVLLAYFLVAGLRPDLLTRISEMVDPWHQRLLFAFTIAIWLLAALLFYRMWRRLARPVDGALALVSFWLGLATYSMHWFPLWNQSWWLYHFLLLVSFLLVTGMLVGEYEQARQFNLWRYFLAVSLLAIALIALLATDRYAMALTDSLSAEIQAQTERRIDGMAGGTSLGLDPSMSERDQLEAYTQVFAGTNAIAFYVYDITGRIHAEYYSDGSRLMRVRSSAGELVADNKFGYFSKAMGFETVSHIIEPGSLPPGYEAPEAVHAISVFAALRAANPEEVAGVIEIIEPLPALTAAGLAARRTGLLIATVSAAAIFMALLAVVRRGDRIITERARDLNQAYDELKRSENIREDLTRMIIHDLRNPLAAISASLDLMKMAGTTPEKQDHFTGLARDASNRMSTLIDDLLTVSRIESGELELKREDISIPQLILDRVEGFRPQLASEQKTLEIDCPPELRAALDGELIARVLDNLIGNAVKYIESGSGQITIRAHQSRSQIAISVLDNGIGIPDAYKEAVFEKFVQVPADEADVRRGTGLGLAFCRMVVEAHDGRIEAKNAPGSGTEFIIRIPAR